MEETASAKCLGNGVPGMIKRKQRGQWKNKIWRATRYKIRRNQWGVDHLGNL